MGSIKSSNVVWHEIGVTTADLEALHGHRGATVWFTGLPSSGKSTLANATARALLELGVSVTVLDGDNIRHGLNGNLGFSPEDRTENIRRIGEVANLFSAAAVVNLTAFISPYAADRAVARRMQPERFVEVFCEAPLDVCERRDPKGMYRAARAGKIKGFTGVDAPYEAPERPELRLRTHELSIADCVEVVVEHLHAHRFIERNADGPIR